MRRPHLASARQPRAATCCASAAGMHARLGMLCWRVLRPDSDPGDWPHGWQLRASRVLHTYYRKRKFFRSQSGPQAGAWLTAVPTDAGTTLPPAHMHVALRRRLRLPGCGGALDALGDHAAACPRSGLLARRAPLIEQAWVRVAREALGPEARVVPQQWLAHTTAPGVAADDRRRLDFVLYGATRLGEALCCDVTLVSPLRRNGRPQPRAAEHDGAVLAGARRRRETRYPELAGPGPQRLVVLACEVGGRFGSEAFDLVRRLVRVRSLRAPAALRCSAAVAQRRWWGLLGVALQRAVVSTLLGGAWLSPAQPAADAAPDLGDVLGLGDAPLPSRLPLRG